MSTNPTKTAPTHGGQETTEWVWALIDHAPRHFMVVDHAGVYVSDPAGFWVSLKSPEGEGVLHSLVRDVAGTEQSTGRVSDVRGRLSRLLVEADGYEVQQRAAGELNRHPLVRTQTGAVIDLRHDKNLSPVQVRGRLVTKEAVPTIDYRPWLLDEPPPDITAAVEHYGGGTLLYRMAYLLLGPHKAIDMIRMPVSNAGKTTLAEWVKNALPGGVEILDARAHLRESEFPELHHQLTTRMIVFLDEADKIESPPPAARVNRLTDETVWVNRKFQPKQQLPRTANAVMLGADWPAIVTGQGADTRFRWAYDAPQTKDMSQRMRDALMTNDAAAWLGTLLVHLAGECYRGGFDGSNADTEAAARDLNNAVMDPLYRVMLDILMPGGPDAQALTTEIKAMVHAHPLAPELGDIDRLACSPRWKRAITNAVPGVRLGRNNRARLWSGLKVVPPTEPEQ